MTSTCTIMDGNAVAERVLERVRVRSAEFIQKTHRKPRLLVVLFGTDPSSLSYIRKKEAWGIEAGLDVVVKQFPDVSETEEAKKIVRDLQNEAAVDGLIVQLPLPDTMQHPQSVLEEINPSVDVDCLTMFSLGLLAAGSPLVVPPTPAAILELLNAYEVDLHGAHVVLVGYGKLVGKPLSILLTQEHTTVTVCNEHTRDLGKHTREADILICATGVKDLIRGDMVKEGAVVLDAGTAVEGRKVSGDVHRESVVEKARLLSPVPGGVGPVTVAKLFENVVELGLRSSSHA